ncbi:MAG: ROK family protein [Actinobacteria bacterium]|nr:ROK family protein [Actinomycetota bacterium]
MAYLAVDVGGTKLAVGVIDDAGAVLSHSAAPTPRNDVWGTLEQLVTSQLREATVDIVTCGVGCGGPMSLDGEDVSPLNIPDWRNFPLRDKLRKLTGLEVFIANDAQALVLGEVWCGAAQGRSDVIGMVVSTGVGGGIVSGGRLVTGRSGNGGHIGHVIVEPDGRLCACGARGCLEAHASGRSIEAITGVPAAQATLQTKQLVGRQVGRALASVGALMDLDFAVIGGSVALGFGEPFFRAVQDELEASARIEFIRGFRVSPVGLGAFAPLVGAAAVARSATSV